MLCFCIYILNAKRREMHTISFYIIYIILNPLNVDLNSRNINIMHLGDRDANDIDVSKVQ